MLLIYGSSIAAFLVVHLLRKRIASNPVFIAYVSIAFVVVVVGSTGYIFANQTNPSGGIFTTKTWFCAGWDTGLSIFSIRIDTWYKYTLVAIYQIVRSIVGSLLSNFLRPFLTVSVLAVGSKRPNFTTRRQIQIIAAQVRGRAVPFNPWQGTCCPL